MGTIKVEKDVRWFESLEKDLKLSLRWEKVQMII